MICYTEFLFELYEIVISVDNSVNSSISRGNDDKYNNENKVEKYCDKFS